MKTLFIINDPPYGTERAYNALRLAEFTRRSTLDEMTDWTQWADKVLVF